MTTPAVPAPIYFPMPHDEVVRYLGPSWPPAAGATVLRVPESAGITDGGVAVYPGEGLPGMTWWVADSLIVPQGAGDVDEQLAASLAESVLETVPGFIDPDAPPPPPDTYTAFDTPTQ